MEKFATIGMIVCALIIGFLLGFLLFGQKTATETEFYMQYPEHIPTAQEQEMFDAVNAVRAEAGVPPVRYDGSVYVCTSLRTDEIYLSHSHERDGGRRAFTVLEDFRIDQSGWAHYAENIGGGTIDVAEAMDGLMNSEKHRTNMLNPDYTAVCICIRTDENGLLYFTQHFFQEIPEE